uniref:CHCH domain-containing protein n=1 Tax=Phaeomonas parva TaxID=124430 RepID=A0A7S1UB76_9STRA|mmetsp:Transcript_3707/g.10644  ORF Transcript_3707/g.10644 Transcript_3707/m.10644 type:complete len:140 (+) Transcript_3707:211-630(+)
MGGSQSADQGAAEAGKFSVEATGNLAQQILNIEANRRARMEMLASTRDEELAKLGKLVDAKANAMENALNAEAHAMEGAQAALAGAKTTWATSGLEKSEGAAVCGGEQKELISCLAASSGDCAALLKTYRKCVNAGIME